MKYHATHLEDSILKLYKALELNTAKEPIELIAEKLGIYISYNSKINYSIEGIIFLKTVTKIEELREVFLHELGHLLCHAGIQVDMTESFREIQEAKAHNFALHFSVPTFRLHNMDLPTERRQAVQLIAEEFGVTHTFAAKQDRLFRLMQKVG